MSSREQRQRRERAAAYGLAALLAGSGLALGTLYTTTLAVVALAAAALFVVLWLDAPPTRLRPSAALLTLLGAGAVAFTLVQAVPLPRSLVAMLSPEAADVWSRALLPMGEQGSGFITLSLDPVATRVQVLRGVTYLLVYLAALRVAATREGSALLERALVASGVVMALVALAHPAVGASSVLGAYKPREAYAYDPSHLGPLLNTNHLAAYLNLAMTVAFAATLAPRSSIPRPLALAAVVVLAATSLWSASRGGTAALVASVSLVTVLTLATRSVGRGARHVPILLTALVVVAGATLLGLGASDFARADLSSTDTSKLDLARDALRLVPSFPLVGVGRGAFESVFPVVRRHVGYDVSTHPENVVAQLLVEWGVPFAMVVMVGVGWALRPSVALSRSRPSIGPWAAIACVVLHNLVDFSLEVPAVVLALCVCAALVTGGAAGVPSTLGKFEGWGQSPRRVAFVGAGALVAAVALAMPGAPHELYEERNALHHLAVDRAVPDLAFRDRVRAAMLRHPAEPYFPLIGGVRASLSRTESVVPWVARALERSPTFGRAHLLLARELARRVPSQARLSYRLAYEQDPDLASLIATELPPLIATYEDALSAIPAAEAGVALLDQVSDRLAPRMPATSARLDQEILRRAPKHVPALRREAARSVTDLTERAPWCEGPRRAACASTALTLATSARDAAPSECEGHLLVAKVGIASGRATESFAALSSVVHAVRDRSVCARAVVDLAFEENRPAQSRAALDRLVRLGCGTASECVENYSFAARREGDLGNHRSALVLYKRASQQMPALARLYVPIAETARAVGLHGEAMDAFNTLARLEPGEPRWRQGADEERVKLASAHAPATLPVPPSTP